MKKLNYLFYLLAIPAMAFLASCGGSDEPTPDTAPDAKVFTTTMTTSNGGNSGAAIVTGKVTTSDGTVKLRLDVTSTDDVDQIFILKSEDNGALTPVIAPTLTDITNSSGTFKAGTNESFKVPGSVKSFILDVPVSVRTSSSAVTDVYYIWLTKKNLTSSGSFTKPSKNLVLGSSVITLNYTASSVVAFSTATIDVASQSSTSAGSFIVTSGQVSALNTADYNDAPGSADIRLVTLNASGKKDNSSTDTYFYSPADVTAANPSGDGSADFSVPAGSRTTYISVFNPTSFDAINGTDLTNLNVGTNKSVKIVQGGIYQFQTATGKKGVIRVNTLAAGGGGQVANVTVKVLN